MGWLCLSIDFFQAETKLRGSKPLRRQPWIFTPTLAKFIARELSTTRQ
jgi:hypothetical protein